MSPSRGGSDVIPPGVAPAVVRAVKVLDVLGDNPGRVMSLTEIARALDLPKSSTSALCGALELGGLIKRDDLGYSLGRRLVELGGAYLAGIDQISEFYRLCNESDVFRGETLRLSAAAGMDTLCLARHEGYPVIRLTSGIGDRSPASASAQGKVLLAKLEDAEIIRMYNGLPELPRMTRHSRRTVSRLLKDIALTRANGYGFDDEEAADTVVGLAVDIPTRGVRAPVLAVSVTYFKSRFNDQVRDRFLAELRRLAAKLGNPLETL